MRIRADRLTKKVTMQHGLELTILQNISLEIESGARLGIIGVSGSGKSTLLGLLAGLDLPTEGDIYWDETHINALSEDKRANLRLNQAGFVFQNFELLPAYTALENVLLPLELTKKPDAVKIAYHRLKEVDLLARCHHYPNQLSGGEQQRVAIARAFAIEPKIIFLDEPTGNLDQKTGRDIIHLLSELNTHHKTTLVCVTHDSALTEICTHTLHIAGGELVSNI